MAELDVQPKKRSSNSFFPWLLLTLGVIALVFFITRNGDQYVDEARPVAGPTTTYSNTSENAARSDWNGIDFYNSPKASFNEIKNNQVEVRGNEEYAIYQIDVDELFDDGVQLKKNADKALSEIVESINTRFSNGEVRLYGNSDTQNDASSKQQAERMGAIKNWLNQNGLPNLTAHPMDVKKGAGMVDDDVRIIAMRANN
jgi:hypothetical protein